MQRNTFSSASYERNKKTTTTQHINEPEGLGHLRMPLSGCAATRSEQGRRPRRAAMMRTLLITNNHAVPYRTLFKKHATAHDLLVQVLAEMHHGEAVAAPAQRHHSLLLLGQRGGPSTFQGRQTPAPEQPALWEQPAIKKNVYTDASQGHRTRQQEP